MLLRRCVVYMWYRRVSQVSAPVSTHPATPPAPVENRTHDYTSSARGTAAPRSPASTTTTRTRTTHVQLELEDILNKKQEISVHESEKSSVFGLELGSRETGELRSYYCLVTGRCDVLLAKLESCDVSEIVQIVDDIVGHVVMLNKLASFLAQSISARREEARAVLQKSEQYLSMLNTNTLILTSLKRVVSDTEHWEQLDEEGRRVVLLLLVDFRNQGLDLPADKQAELQELNKQVVGAGVAFVKESIKAVHIPLEECPDTLLSLPCQADKVVLSDWCDNVPSHAIREAGWLNYFKYNPKQEDTLHRLLDKRQQLAIASGYANYAERALQGSMAGSPAAVKEFLTELHEQIRPIAKDESYELEKWKFHGSNFWYNKGHGSVNEVVIFPWDTPFFRDEMQHLWIKQETRKYPSLPDFLSVGTVIEQIGVWLEDTFGVTLIAERPLDGELWSADVIKLAVEHEREGLLGFLYLDFYDGAQKKSPPCHHIIRSGTQKQIPISVIECNYTPSNGYRPPHLNMKTLTHLFQQLGAAVHAMLSRSQYNQTSANFMSPDTRLISSYLMGNLARHPTVLYHVMKHHTRTRILPRIGPRSISVMCNAMSLIGAHEIEYQLLYSALDQTFHTEWGCADGATSTDIFARHVEHYTHLPYVEGTAPHLRFNPLVTQGGHCYSHLWCKAIANILYEELFVIDPFSRHAGEYLREHLLQHGASRKPREMVEYLTGSKLTADRLASALCRPIETSQNIGHGYTVLNDSGGTQWWHRQVSSPDSALFSRLSGTHPHLVSRQGHLKLPPKFNKPQIATAQSSQTLG